MVSRQSRKHVKKQDEEELLCATLLMALRAVAAVTRSYHVKGHKQFIPPSLKPFISHSSSFLCIRIVITQNKNK